MDGVPLAFSDPSRLITMLELSISRTFCLARMPSSTSGTGAACGCASCPTAGSRPFLSHRKITLTHVLATLTLLQAPPLWKGRGRRRLQVSDISGAHVTPCRRSQSPPLDVCQAMSRSHYLGLHPPSLYAQSQWTSPHMSLDTSQQQSTL